MAKKRSKLGTYLLLIVLAAMVLGMAAPFFLQRTRSLSAQEAGEKAIAYINETMKLEASLIDVTEESGMYKVRLKIKDQEFPSYVSKDGRFLFPNAIDLEMKPGGAGKEEEKEIPKSDQPEVHLYVMSFCPYGNQAEEAMKPVVELLGDSVEIEPHYVIYENYASGYPEYCLEEENKYCSMHGIDELNQNIREMCVYQNQREKFWPFVDEVNKNCTVETVEKCWENAAQKTGVDIDSVKACQTNKGLAFVQKEKELNDKYEVRGSPTLVINGVRYAGERTSEGYKKAICNAFNNPPEACSQELSSEASSGSSGGCQ